MIDTIQDDELVKADLRNHDRLKTERAPWENAWEEIDRRVNPGAEGGFNVTSPGQFRGQQNFDVTAVDGLDKFASVMSAISVPETEQYIRPRFADKDLDKLPEVRRWCERAGDRLYAIRYAAHTAFGTAADEDFRQLGTYGTAPLWSAELPGVGLFYRALHLSECYIDTDLTGMVDTAHRAFKRTARQIEGFYGRACMTPKMIDALDKGKEHTEFELVYVCTPNRDWDPDKFDWRGKPVSGRLLAPDEKLYMKREGFHTMPISVSRHSTSPGDKYGRSPAFKMMPTINGVNVMRRDTLRAGQKAVDPALMFYSDDGITSLVSKPGGMNPGMVDEFGRLMVARLPGGENGIPYAMEMIEQERAPIRSAFLEDFFKLLVDDKVQRSAQAVLEIASKQGLLVAPYASRYRTEKQNPVTQRDLDLALRAGQVEPLPQVVIEAGAWPVIDYDNPIGRMARAEEASGLTRWIEVMTPLAQLDEGAVFDHINTDEAAKGLGEVLGVRPSWIATDDEVAAKRAAREEAKGATAGVEALGTVAGAYKDIAQGNQIAAAA